VVIFFGCLMCVLISVGLALHLNRGTSEVIIVLYEVNNVVGEIIFTVPVYWLVFVTFATNSIVTKMLKLKKGNSIQKSPNPQQTQLAEKTKG
jgi:hypothetical protein